MIPAQQVTPSAPTVTTKKAQKGIMVDFETSSREIVVYRDGEVNARRGLGSISFGSKTWVEIAGARFKKGRGTEGIYLTVEGAKELRLNGRKVSGTEILQLPRDVN